MPHIEEPESLRAPDDKKPRETSGQWLWKTLRPAGCVLVLVMAVLMVAYCLTQGRDPIRGYAPPQTTEYYAAHPDELLKELEQSGPAVPVPTTPPEPDDQISLMCLQDARLRERLEKITVETLTPIEAMNLLYELKQML